MESPAHHCNLQGHCMPLSYPVLLSFGVSVLRMIEIGADNLDTISRRVESIRLTIRSCWRGHLWTLTTYPSASFLNFQCCNCVVILMLIISHDLVSPLLHRIVHDIDSSSSQSHEEQQSVDYISKPHLAITNLDSHSFNVFISEVPEISRRSSEDNLL